MRRATPTLALLLLFALPLGGQGAPRLSLQLPADSLLAQVGPMVQSRSVLSDDRMRELLASGFPARLHYRVELWSDESWFDDLHGTAEWDVYVRWRGVDQMYEVTMRIGDRTQALGAYRNVEDAEAAVERPLRVPLAPPGSNKRFYYVAELRVETLSVSDLDEVNAWLRGEGGPAMRGERNPGTALTRGIRSLTTRLLGGERREYGARTGTFRPGR